MEKVHHLTWRDQSCCTPSTSKSTSIANWKVIPLISWLYKGKNCSWGKSERKYSQLTAWMSFQHSIMICYSRTYSSTHNTCICVHSHSKSFVLIQTVQQRHRRRTVGERDVSGCVAWLASATAGNWNGFVVHSCSWKKNWCRSWYVYRKSKTYCQSA